MAVKEVDSPKTQDRWSVLLTRPNGGIVSAFNDPFSWCDPSFKRLNVFLHPPESDLSEGQVRDILSANGIDPDVYFRAQALLREALTSGAVVAAQDAPASESIPASVPTLEESSAPAPAAAVVVEPEVVKPVDEMVVVPAEVVKPVDEVLVVSEEVVKPVDDGPVETVSAAEVADEAGAAMPVVAEEERPTVVIAASEPQPAKPAAKASEDVVQGALF